MHKEGQGRETPGLIAAIDQHAAAVRDVLTASEGALTDQALLDYRAGFMEAALERGWEPVPDRWDWETTRLLAVDWLLSQSRGQGSVGGIAGSAGVS